jgi:NADH-quinone oxidoreductase subunit E
MLDDLMDYLRIAPGETTKDGLFTLETVACFGSCALAPVLVMDDIVHGSMNRSKMISLIDDIRAREQEIESNNIAVER